MAVYTACNGWRWFGRVRASGLALVTAAAMAGWGVAGSGAAAAQASVYPGALRLTVAKVVAGAAGDTLGWDYQVPLTYKVAGTISLDVPAGFTAPQASAPGSPGYVSATSGCAQFQVTGTAPQHDGSTMITVAVSCAKGLTGAISYTGVTVPTVAGKYVFAATFTPAAGTAEPFAQGDIVAVQHGPLASLIISPASSWIATGSTQTYTVQGLDAFGNPLGNLTSGTKFTISPDGSCGRSFCTASVNGPHIVTATDRGVTTTASLTVATLDADLAVTQTVTSATPYYYAPVTFETTVTNTSPGFTSYGISATVAEPSGLVSPVATPSGSTSYDPATGIWTIGSLAPGASATLDISSDAGDVLDGTQTVTATATATTPDPNQANNTASASEASQPAPIAALITADPNNQNPVDVCASPPVTNTWDGATVNAVNPAAPPPAPSSFTYTWSCALAGDPFNSCPFPPANNSYDSPFISYISNEMSPGDAYLLTLTITPNGTDPNYQTYAPGNFPSTYVTILTGCLE
jgi:Domain of unknown function DUF11